MLKFLIWGANGWIGNMLVKLLSDKYIVICAKSRIQDYASILAELQEHKPDFVLNTAGLTGVPNVDWCEDHKQETMHTNVCGTVNLAHACATLGIHMTNYASGCIYTYPQDSTGNLIYRKFTEEDAPNFEGSTYSISKALAQKILSYYPNVLTLRLRMPISYDLHKKNFITKISKYEKVINIPNSVTVLPELLPISIEMTLNKITGIYNFTNPGAITHNEVLSYYRDYIDVDFTWKNFTVEEQNLILKSKRSNCELDTTKLELFCKEHKLHISDVQTAMRDTMIEIKKSLK